MAELLKDKDRPKLMRTLHAQAKAMFDIDNPHPLLHQLAVAEFDVKSMSHITADEIQILIDKIKENNVSWAKVEQLGLTRIPEMSDKQKWLVKKLQKELSWSSDYLNKLAIQRYGYLEYRYLTGKPAIAFVGYLIKRSRTKRGIK